MTTPPRPDLKSLQTADRPHHATTTRHPTLTGGQEKVARQGVHSALRRDPPPDGDGRYPVAWLHITAPKGAIPTATSICECGRNRSAVGRRQVLALIEEHTAHRDICPVRHPDASETRNAA